MLGALKQSIKTTIEQKIRPKQPETLPVLLKHARIYILPTGFGWFLLALLLVMLIGALNYNNNPAFMLALMLSATTFASGVTAYYQLFGLQFKQFSAESVVAGKPIELVIDIHPSKPRSLSGLAIEFEHLTAFVGASIPAQTDGSETIHTFHHAPSKPLFSTEVDSLGNVQLRVLVPTYRRGLMQIPRFQVFTKQPLGLIKIFAWVWPNQSVLIYPAPEAKAPPLPEANAGKHSSKFKRGGEELRQLRNYRQGDPIRSISWKHSARRNALLVREMEHPEGKSLVLDWGSMSGLNYEQRIARLARWVDEATHSGLQFRLILPSQAPLGPNSGAAFRLQCLRTLALMPQG